MPFVSSVAFVRVGGDSVNVKIMRNSSSRAFDVNFGELIFPDRINYPRPQKIDPFDGIHEVQSDRYVHCPHMTDHMRLD